VFIFIWECTRLLPNEIYSVSVKYIFDYKVKFLRYTRTYSLNGRGRRKVRNETETKHSETKRNTTKRNEIRPNETKSVN
jgi:hypothetical protein